MPEPNDCEAFEFRRLFRVHRIFAAVPWALRPGALLLAVFITLLLSLGGRAWDGIRGPIIGPPGLLPMTLMQGSRDLGREVPRELSPDEAQNVTRMRLSRLAVELVPRHMRPEGMSLEDVDPWWLATALDETRRSIDPVQEAVQIERINRALAEVTQQLTPRGTFTATARALGQALTSVIDGVVTLDPAKVVESIRTIVVGIPVALWQRDRGFIFFFGLYAGIVLAVGAGALSRMTAVAFADRPAINPADATSFALSRWTSFAFAVLLPPLFVGGLFLLGGVMGLLLRVPVINIAAGALYGVALLLGFLAAIVGILWILVLPLTAPAVSCDGADAVESCQRAAAYVLRRPLLALGYLVAAIVAWGLGVFVVRVMYVATVNLTAASGVWLSGAPALRGAGGLRIFGSEPAAPLLLTGTDRATAWLIEFWVQVAGILAAGAALGILISVATAVYLCLRNACDDQPFDDLWDPEEAPGVRLEAG